MTTFAGIIKLDFSMRSYISLALTASVALVCSCGSSRKSQESAASTSSHWQQQPLTIDGSDADWSTKLAYADNVQKLNYDITNDAQNIYIRIATNDQQAQQKIIQGGMTVWINNQAQKEYDHAVGIGFPMETRPTREQDLMRQAQPDKYPSGPTQVKLSDCHQYALYNFGDEEAIANYDYGATNKSGVSVQMGYNAGNTLLYEASIPLASVFPRGNSIGKSYAVGIYLEGIPGAHDSGPRGGGSGVSVGGGLGFGSFGSGGGLSIGIGTGSLGRNGGNKNSIAKQTKVWQVVDVARAQ